MTKPKRDQLLNNIKKDIKKVGYPVELRVGGILEEYGWGVEHNPYFLDKDENKGREIDISAYKQLTTGRVTIGLHLLCEVKCSPDKPWVIFSTKQHKVEGGGWLRPHYTHGIKKLKTSGYDLESTSSYGTAPRIGRTYYEAFKKPDAKSEIFEALVKTVKATEACVETNLKALKDTSSREPLKLPFLAFAEPVIVLNGLLYEAWINDKSEIELNDADHVVVSFRYISELYKRKYKLVDLITIDKFAEFISSKIKWIDNTSKVISF